MWSRPASLQSALLLVALALAADAAPVEFAPSLLFGDNMVLSESVTRSARIFGFAAAQTVVTLADSNAHHAKARYSATADASGKWTIALAPYVVEPGDANNFTLTLTNGGAKKTAANAAYGTVLLCSGQSNMELNLLPIYNTTTIIAAANHPNIRLFTVNRNGSKTEARQLQPKVSVGPAHVGTVWTPVTPATIPTFSAICYLTALHYAQRVPGGMKKVYGLVSSNIGSTDVQSWMSQTTRAKALKTCWRSQDGKPAIALPPSASHAPAGFFGSGELFNAMIYPMIGNLWSGILWDQGENNGHYCNTPEYNCLFGSKIEGWRSAFGDGDTPYAFVQLGGYSGGYTKPLGAKIANVSTIRFAQSATQHQVFSLFSNFSRRVAPPRTAMVPTYDLGSPEPGADPEAGQSSNWWIHCRNKSEVGRRMALQLLQIMPPLSSSGDGAEADEPASAAAAAAEEWSGPVVSSVKLVAPAGKVPHVELAFAHADGLRLSPAQGCQSCCNQTFRPQFEQGSVFQVANRQGVWLDAVGSLDLEGSKLIVRPTTTVTCGGAASSTTSSIGGEPVGGCWLAQVRFAAIDIPQCVLYNAASLPAVPFQFPMGYTAKSM